MKYDVDPNLISCINLWFLRLWVEISDRNTYLKIYYLTFIQGRIFQIEYAMEAVKQGSATVGLKSKDYAVLVALKVGKMKYVNYCRLKIKIKIIV